MTISHTIRQQWTGASGESLSGDVTETGNVEINTDLSIAGTTADQQFDLDFLFANLKSVYMLSTIDVTIETNATDASGGDTISLVANVPFTWQDSSGLANPFTANVTTVYVTPGGATAGTLKIKLLCDAAA